MEPQTAIGKRWGHVRPSGQPLPPPAV